MHELSIAQSITEIVHQYVPDGRRVQWVKVGVGELSGIVPDSLEFCFSVIVADTPLEGARLIIDQIPIQARCRQCDSDLRIESALFACSACGSADLQMLSGTELKVVEIELNEKGSVDA